MSLRYLLLFLSTSLLFLPPSSSVEFIFNTLQSNSDRHHLFLMSLRYLLFFLSTSLLFLTPSSSVEFIFNTNFTSANINLYGTATIENSILSLTNDTSFSIGRAFYPSRIPTKERNSSSSAALPFSTSFIFSISPYRNRLPGHGFAFVFMPFSGISGASSAQHLGLFNLTNDGDPDNNVLAVEFDVFNNQEFNDIDDNHVGIDLNSLTSLASTTAGFWRKEEDGDFDFTELRLNNGENYQVWIDYNEFRVNVTMAKAGERRPSRPLISESLNLSMVLLDEMFVGFCGATGQLVESHKILSWSFSNSNFSIGDALVTSNLPSFVLPKDSILQSKGFISGVIVGGVLIIGLGIVIFLVWKRKKEKGKEEEIEDWELDYWPHRIGYQEIYASTMGFSEENVIGYGENGKVYKGIFQGVEVALKRISLESEDGMRAFLAEVSSLGRLKHRNLVRLRGWCRKGNESLILVYDYMENGSLDKWVFDFNDQNMILDWEQRSKILKDVASAILYLHEGLEYKVLHRDIKSSNVLLNKDMNAKLGDFGLARIHHHSKLSTTTRVMGTVGYMAPEVVRTGRASAKTDVFGFGVLVLEVVCGRKPIEEGKPNLIDWLWGLVESGELGSAFDERIKSKGGYSDEDVQRVLHLGLLCAHPDENARPKMRQVVKFLEGSNEADEDQDEGVEANLIGKMGENSSVRSYWDFNGSRGHPTFNEIHKTYSSSVSLNNSDLILEGR